MGTSHPYDVFHRETDISTALATRMEAIADEVAFPIKLTVEETEEVIRILWEFCGNIPILLVNLRGGRELFQLRDLFPRPFDASFLKS